MLIVSSFGECLKNGLYDYMSFTHELDWIARDANGKLGFNAFSPRGLKETPPADFTMGGETSDLGELSSNSGLLEQGFEIRALQPRDQFVLRFAPDRAQRAILIKGAGTTITNALVKLDWTVDGFDHL